VAENDVTQKEKNSFRGPKDFCDFHQFSFGAKGIFVFQVIFGLTVDKVQM
jgi:hypothetical protein